MNKKLTPEINKFNQLAHDWWDADGQLKTLHQINPCRLEYIKSNAQITPNTQILDVGCGGGILSESLARLGAGVSGIDLAPDSIEIAKLHLYESGLNIDYQCISSTNKAKTHHEYFDVITCMELLEHVDNPIDIIQDCSNMLKSGGTIFFSTLNRTSKSYITAILGAEYLLKLIPLGTHNYAKFITPDELDKILRVNNLKLNNITGIGYNPITGSAKLINSVAVNYIVCCTKVYS